jgi:Flp pilus assembly protein TadD
LIAANALAAEELGAYDQAVTLLRQLRHVVAPDPDLELALALDEARTGESDSAAARLATPLMEKALADTMPLARRHTYVWQRDPLWINGRWDGWPWYIARARAEIAATAGRWPEARNAARVAVAMRPLAGKEWHMLALCAARLGNDREADSAATQAVSLDPSLPEAHHLAGLLA